MRKLILLLGGNKEWVIIFSLFLLTIFSIVSLFPKKATFKYDFFKGKPWMHETLIAPFNFSILKTNVEIKDEKRIIQEQHLPFFEHNVSVYEKQAAEFILQFETKWAKDRNIRKDDKFTFFNLSKQRKIDNKTRKYTLANYGLEQLNILYDAGIIQLHADYEWKDKDLMVLVARDGVAQKKDINDCYTISQASDYLSKLTKLSQVEYHFLVPILSNCLEHNIIYNESESEKILKAELSSINLYKGLIQKGQIIITQGEIVNESNYQELISYRNEYEGQGWSKSSSITTFFGQFLLVGLSFFILFLFIKQFRVDILEEKNKLLLILFQIILIITASILVLRFNSDYLYIIPFCILPIVLKAFFDNRIALFSHLISILIIGFIVPNSFEFVFLQLMAGIISILTVIKMYKRAQLFVSATKIVIIYFIIYLSLYMMYEGSLTDINWNNLIYFLASGLLTLFAYPMIFGFERIFNLVSDISLLELADTNNPLLRRLSEEAPGTFQHSLQVANLSEEAIIEIGGNSLLVRAGAIYHDIGKIKDPMYFIENQNANNNPHSNLSYEDSAKLIINHVSEGISLATTNKLPNQLIDFIRTHHGTSTVEYFYKKFLDKFPEEEDKKMLFTYPGPKPFSKETAVLMMADAVEAAARSLTNPNASNISMLVDNIIDKQMNQGQFMEADITFKQITIIKDIFKKKLTNIHHSRLEY